MRRPSAGQRPRRPPDRRRIVASLSSWRGSAKAEEERIIETHLLTLGGLIESERLCLEPICPRHAPLLFEAMQDPAIYTWISTLPPTSVESLAERWGRVAARSSLFDPGLSLGWAVRRPRDGAWVGKMDAEINRQGIATNVGYLLFPPFWGQGLATEALSALSDHLNRCGIREQRATVTVGNVASERVLLRAGFRRGQILPGNDTIRGVPADDVEYIRRVRD